MDSILGKLSEIETAAFAIVNHAESQKDVLEEEMRKKRDAFDAELEEDTQYKIQKIRDELKKKTDEVLSSQTGTSTSSIEAVKKEFNEKHTIYAKEILSRITEV
ncbi:MAG: hypothetical protein PHN80_15230 [Hespellia sp.]|nr:hypothetical protein [Hespellia sp.]